MSSTLRCSVITLKSLTRVRHPRMHLERQEETHPSPPLNFTIYHNAPTQFIKVLLDFKHTYAHAIRLSCLERLEELFADKFRAHTTPIVVDNEAALTAFCHIQMQLHFTMSPNRIKCILNEMANHAIQLLAMRHYVGPSQDLQSDRLSQGPTALHHTLQRRCQIYPLTWIERCFILKLLHQCPHSSFHVGNRLQHVIQIG